MFMPLALSALAIEAAFGYPPWLYRRIGHPVTWIGALIGWGERRLNDPALSFTRRRRNGGVLLLIVLLAAGGGGGALQWALSNLSGGLGFAAAAIAASSLLAQRSLDRHVRAVADALDTEGLAGGRSAVAHIVGRDTAVLDEPGVCRAAIESLAENFSDGVVAPLLWLALGGLPGATIYKAVNTADSMIGHRSERYRAFGWAPARLDDLINLPASRLSALWLIAAALAMPGASARGALAAVWRDARKHRSPNAGWPEAAMAGALRLKLAGPRVYGGHIVADHHMGNGRADAAPGDIRRALTLYRVALGIEAGVVAVLAGLAVLG